MNAVELPPVSDLVPHCGEILLLERVLEHDGESTAARVAVGSQTWLTSEDGSVASWLALEYMAQCVAAHEGMLAHVEGRPLPRGYLVAATELRLHRPRFEANEILRVRARRLRGRPGLGVLSHFCTIHPEGESDEGALLAEGRLSVSVPRPSATSADQPLRR